MIPQLESAPLKRGQTCAPPLRFRPLTGPIGEVQFKPRTYTRQSGVTDAQENGLRYEAKVQDWLISTFPTDYVPEPFVHFTDCGVYRTARPDGVLVYPDRIVIVEIKYSHVPEAWWQLEKLYKVVLDRLWHRPISLVEICRSYDPATPFPCEVELIPDLVDWVSRPRDIFGVFQWRKPIS